MHARLCPLRFLSILDVIPEAAEWKATFIADGSEPARGGSLNMIK